MKILSKTFIIPKKNNFTQITYQKCQSLQALQDLTDIKFPNTKIETNNLKDGNFILSQMCHLYNMTKGKILFPPVIETYTNKNSRFAGEYGNGVMKVNCGHREEIPRIISHETAHYNHELCCQDYEKMGKENELIANNISDFSYFEEFRHNGKQLKLIRKHLRGYATSSALEFVACTFEALANNKKLPIELWELYKKYEGPFADQLKSLFNK